MQQRERCLDLPLAVNPCKEKHSSSKQLQDLPRQLKNDIYRVSNKQNLIKAACSKAKDPFLNQFEKNTPIQGQKITEKNCQRERNTLKQLLKKKLSIIDEKKERKPSEMKQKQRKEIGVQNENRYHQLLQQFYGGPKINKKSKEIIQNNEPTLTRHQSSKSIKNGCSVSKKSGLQKMRSFSSLKSPKQTVHFPSKNPTYLDLYMEKRKPLLNI